MDFMPDYYESLKTGDLDRVRDLFHKDPAMLQARSHEGISLVLLAIYYAEPEIAEFLIEQGAPLDIFDLAATGDTNGLQ
ncbi:MAG: ankyrin repeat domain-containing protein, partial [Anaerolineaceae bacterium]|nr:ankyrin repeat domain-containing protein [Anaerolineaceae bacterium]